MDKSNHKFTDQGYGKSKKVVIFGTGDLAQIISEYFEHDSDYEVAGFTVDGEYAKGDVVPFEKVEEYFPPESHDMYIAVVYGDMNRIRQKKFHEAKDKRYDIASYISSKAFVSPSAKIDEGVTIFENNVVQPFVEIGDGCILWSGNHVGHHSHIGNFVFVSSHVVISGHCSIGDNCFLGVNSTIANSINIGKESWIMHGAIISSDIPDNSFVKTVQSECIPLNESALNRALERKKK